MSEARKWSVSLADDHPMILDALQSLIGKRPEFEVVSSSTDGVAALEEIRSRLPDLAIIDINMPRLSGLNLLRELADRQIATKTILLTAMVSEERVNEAIRLGVRGIVLKENAPQMLLDCMSRVVVGERWFSPELLVDQERLQPRSESDRRRSRPLTVRESEIEELVVAGFSNKEIARRLGLSEGTIKIHLHNIYEKLGINSRTALVTIALSRRNER
jgi:DNA-binding NarL/FixJ family response regulator